MKESCERWGRKHREHPRNIWQNDSPPELSVIGLVLLRNCTNRIPLRSPIWCKMCLRFSLVNSEKRRLWVGKIFHFGLVTAHWMTICELYDNWEIKWLDAFKEYFPPSGIKPRPKATLSVTIVSTIREMFLSFGERQLISFLLLRGMTSYFWRWQISRKTNLDLNRSPKTMDRYLGTKPRSWPRP